MRYVSVINVTTSDVLAERAVVAESFFARLLGLQWRRSLPQGTGMALIPSSSIHMFFMFMRIDAVFVGEDGRVLRVGRRLRPWTIGPIVPKALYCVELPEDAAKTTRKGHQIELRRTDAS